MQVVNGVATQVTFSAGSPCTAKVTLTPTLTGLRTSGTPAYAMDNYGVDSTYR